MARFLDDKFPAPRRASIRIQISTGCFRNKVYITKSDAGSAAPLQNPTPESNKKVPDKVPAPRLYFRISISQFPGFFFLSDKC